MKRVLFLCFAILSVSIAHSQKIYQTRSGKISFLSATPVMDIDATNNEVSAKLSTNGQMVFMAAIRGFVFENKLMQEHFNENYMESDKFPKAVFMGTVQNIKEVDFSKDGSYPVKVEGELEIHGTKNKIQTPGTLEVKGGKVTARAEFNVGVTDYGIKGSYIGTKIAKEVKVSLTAVYE
jgi:polyisoprenoid-binding protein YceI